MGRSKTKTSATKKARKSAGVRGTTRSTVSAASIANAVSKAVSSALRQLGQIHVRAYERKPPPWAKTKEPVKVRAYERKPPRWLWELWCRKYPAEARKRGLTCPPPLTGASTNEIGEALMATELVELGKEKVIKKSAIKRATTPEECEAAGGFWRERGGRTWMKEPGECMTPPSWLIDLWRRKGIEVTVLEGLCEMGDSAACSLCGIESSGMGYFIRPEESCPAGYVKVKTKHPLWKRGEFYMCVHPSAVERLRAQGLVGLGRFFPAAPRPESVLYGVLAGSFATSLGRAMLPRLVPRVKAYAPYINYGLAAAFAAAHLFVKTDFTFGMFLGSIGPAIEALAEQIADLLTPAAPTPAPTPAPKAPAKPEEAAAAKGYRVGQGTPEELERLRKKLQFSFAPTGGQTRVVGAQVGYWPEPVKTRIYSY